MTTKKNKDFELETILEGTSNILNDRFSQLSGAVEDAVNTSSLNTITAISNSVANLTDKTISEEELNTIKENNNLPVEQPMS